MTDENVDRDDALMARLRSADPLRSAEPRPGLVGEILAAAADERVDAAGEPVRDAPVVGIEHARTRRRPGLWMGVAAAAVAAAVVAGGMVNGFGPVGVPEAAPPTMAYGGGPIALGSPLTESNLQMAENDVGGIETNTQVGIQPGTYLRHDSGSYDFIAEGLSDVDGTAPAFAFDGRSAGDPMRADALARALGIAGDPQIGAFGDRTYGPADYSAPTLSVIPDSQASFSYQNPAIPAWICAAEAMETDVEPCVPPGIPPGEDVARDVMNDVLEGAGWDPAAFAVTVETPPGSAQAMVSAALIVEGQHTAMTIQAAVDQVGIAHLYGFFADVVSLGDYPIVSEQEAFERLSDSRFGGHWSSGHGPAEQFAESFPEVAPEGPAPGDPLPWEVTEVHIESARLGLASHWRQDGAVALVPAYEFRDAEGGSWSVIAVADAGLDLELEALGEPGSAATGVLSEVKALFGGSVPVTMVDFTAEELTSESRRESAFTFDVEGIVTEARVTAIVEALGLSGTPSREHGAWRVGPWDGSGPSLNVGVSNPAWLSYYNPTEDISCVGANGVYGGNKQADEITLPCEQLASRPSDAEAEAAMRDLLVSLDIDPDDYELRISAGGYLAATTVSARLRGLPTPLAITFGIQADFTAAGLLNLSGRLGALVDLGKYDLVSADEAVERLSDPRFGARRAETGGPGGGVAAWGAPSELPAAGSPVPWPIHDIHIVDAELTLASLDVWDEAAVIVPIYELTDSDGGVWNVIAVVDSQLDFGSE